MFFPERARLKCQCISLCFYFRLPGPGLENPWLDLDAMMVPQDGWEAAEETSATLSFEGVVIKWLPLITVL